MIQVILIALLSNVISESFSALKKVKSSTRSTITVG